MKLFLILCTISFAVSVPPPVLNSNNDVQVLKYDNDNTGFGGYKYSYEQSDGSRQEQYGEIKSEGHEDEHIVVHGSYSWVGPDGVKYIVTYVADEEGFQPEIEQGPGGAVPLDVMKSLLSG